MTVLESFSSLTVCFVLLAAFFRPVFVFELPFENDIIGYWPLDSVNRLKDIGPNLVHGNRAPGVGVSSRPGPFGDEGTAFSPGCSACYVFCQYEQQPNVLSGFTISLFFFGSQASGTSGSLFEFRDRFGTATTTFQFRFVPETTELEIGANNKTIGSFHLVQSEIWTFVSVSYDPITQILTVGSGPYGKVYYQAAPDISQANTVLNTFGFCLGHGTLWGYLHNEDAVSCLSMYSRALNGEEMIEVYDACRKTHGSALSGAPRLPLPPTPSADSTLPSNGQFPFLASIRQNNAHVCIASILSPFWLLTASECFNEGTLSMYTIKVGEYDTGVVESMERDYFINNTYSNDETGVALLELESPIQMTGNYVNDIRIADGSEESIGMLFFGWGENGRHELMSKTLPRYVFGEKTQLANCSSSLSASDFACFREISNNQIPCGQGDIGGPVLVVTETNMFMDGIFVGGGCSGSSVYSLVTSETINKFLCDYMCCTIPGEYYPMTC